MYTANTIASEWLLIALVVLQMLSSQYLGIRHQTWSPVAAQMIRYLCGRYDAAPPDILSVAAFRSNFTHENSMAC